MEGKTVLREAVQLGAHPAALPCALPCCWQTRPMLSLKLVYPSTSTPWDSLLQTSVLNPGLYQQTDPAAVDG